MENLQSPYGKIAFTLLRKKMKNIRIRVTPKSEVIVSAPVHASEKRVHEFVLQSAAFIFDKLKEVEDRRRQYYPICYQSGDTFWHLGEQKRLEVTTDEQTKAVLDGGVLTLSVPPGADERFVKALFIMWMERQAAIIFTKRANRILPAFMYLVKSDVRITIKNMLTRWGSINPKRHSISLSVHLLRCETALIDYIIMHEMCHFAHPNHSRTFYAELEKHCPQRKKMDKKLKVYGLVDF